MANASPIWKRSRVAADATGMPSPGDLLRRAVIGCGLFSAAVGATCAAAAISNENETELQQQVTLLIEQLGSTEFAQREKARDELLELGVAAFDALHEAQVHDDVEIRKQAEYLIRAIRIDWTRDEDPPEVKQIMRNYRGESVAERESRMNRLARVGEGRGINTLCRLARFEASDNLSKRAALLVMNHPLTFADGPLMQADEIRQVIGASQRSGANWLRLFAQYLEAPLTTLDQWQALADAEAAALRMRPDKARLAIQRDFLRWQVDILEKLGRREQAIVTMRQTLPLQNASRGDLLETLDWLIQREAWPLVDVLAEQFGSSFSNDPYLMYRVAESLQRRGDAEAAELQVQQALAVDVKDEPFLHVELGQDLQRRGLLDWAERSYRHVIAVTDEGSHPSLDAGIRLGWMMHDLSRHQDAYESLHRVVALMDKNAQVTRRVRELERDPGRVRGQMHFSHALWLNQQNQLAEERRALEQALELDKWNADILIAMYRVADPPESFRKEALQRIERTVARFESSIVLAERNFQTVPNDTSKAQLALMLNQFAWLVANTTGDFHAALENSKRSLELIPDDAGYLDTLARCYFSLQQYEEAVTHQQRAADLEPHSGQIRRQLELFQEAWNRQRSSATDSPDPSA